VLAFRTVTYCTENEETPSWAALARCCCRWQLMACTSRGPQTARRWSASTGRRSATASDQAQTSAPAPDLAGLADDLAAAWNSPHVTMRTRQQLLRTLVKDLEHHLPLHGCRTPEEALAVMRSMAGKWASTSPRRSTA